MPVMVPMVRSYVTDKTELIALPERVGSVFEEKPFLQSGVLDFFMFLLL